MCKLTAELAGRYAPGTVAPTIRWVRLTLNRDDVVWTTERGALLRRGSFGRKWRRAVAESVGPPGRIHDLRHTHAAWLIADGVHPEAIQARLGRGSIAVTMDRYGHLTEWAR